MSVWNSERPISRIIDPRPANDKYIHNCPRPKRYRPVTPPSIASKFVASLSDPIIEHKSKQFEFESVFEPLKTHKITPIPLVLTKWNENPHLTKITYEWKNQIYKLIRTGEIKVTNQIEYHKIKVVQREDALIKSPQGLTIVAEEWKDICSFYIRVYSDLLPYNGEFYF